MINLNDVALFSRVVEAGSFSGAARALGVPKATVSRNVARLEAALGARLLHRTTRKVELTALGRAYYERARRGLEHLDSAEALMSAAQAAPAGTLRVTAPVELGTRYLMDWIAEFLATADKVRIELILRDGLVDLVQERIDVAFRTGRLENSSNVARRIGPTRRILVASPPYLRKRGMPRQIADLRQHDCIVFGSSLEHAVWRLSGPNGRREVAVSGRIAVDGGRAALKAARAGLGIALLPTGLAADDVKVGQLLTVLPRYSVDGGGLYVVYPSNRHMPVALRMFVEFAIARAKAAIPWEHSGDQDG